MDHYLDILPPLGAKLPDSARVVMVRPERATPSEQETLSKIVTACGLTEGQDCVTVSLPCPQQLPALGVGAVGINGSVQHVVVFGIKARSIGLVAEVPYYTWTPVLGGRRYCFAERLTLLAEDMVRKKRLWETIKSLKD